MMLVLCRKTNESIVIGSNINLLVLAVKGNSVRLGIDAPTEVPIRRAELLTTELPPPLSKKMDETKGSASRDRSEGESDDADL